LTVSGNTLYVEEGGNNTFGEYDATTGALIRSFSLGVDTANGLALSGDELYVSTASNTVNEFNTDTGTLDRSFTTSINGPLAVAVPEPASGFLVVSSLGLLGFARRRKA
jgi:DNA-binding beta-propeller fold protein YncE